MSSEILNLSDFEYSQIISILLKINKSKLHRQLIKTLIKLIKINFNVLPVSNMEELLIKQKQLLITKKLQLASLKHNLMKKFIIEKSSNYKLAINQVKKVKHIMSKPIVLKFNCNYNHNIPNLSIDPFLNIVSKIEEFLMNGDKVATRKCSAYDKALYYLKK